MDYNDKPTLVDGRIRAFMGFNFINSERLTDNASSETLCLVWAKSGAHLARWNDNDIRIDQLPTKRYSTQVYAAGTYGACRVEEKKVVSIACA